ncbi:uncharacterized protein N7506_008042 [Penicillium brevicompactum]|uniref:uncharacterized protein n=1 Tax=Penicillium brevicompactum TaxID=5074 RepID=UPI00253F95BC|nr:uncharacterized protein N7506_008042 [Penicillium brevicompactum]KAJ5334259.1 hypothetical protein N7506_008042 [Penicillium brevicompactum]
MDNSRTRNRNRVTYGTVKGQSRSNPNTTHARPVKVASQGKTVPSSPRISRSSKNGIQNPKEDDKPPGSSGATPAPALAQSQSTTEPDVYDLPSSGDERPIIRRKRRRLSPDAISKHSPTTKRAAGPRDAPNSESRVVDGRDTAASRKPEKAVLKGNVPLKIAKADDQQLMKAEKPSYSRAGRPARGKTEKPAPEDAPAAPHNESSEVSGSEAKSSPITKQRYATAGNVTPGRKRLIDSLGSTKPTLEIPQQSPAASQQSSIPAPRSPASPRVPVEEGHLENHVQASPTAGPPHLRSSGVTYARQRSFLDDMLLEEDLTAPNLSGPQHRSQSVQRQLMKDATSSAQSIVENDEANDEGAVRSIHELRQAGGNARYRGAVESIFEDIEDTQNSVSGRCNALLQLCGKLLDSGLRRRFVECNFDKRLVDCLSMELQMVPATLALCAYALASSDGHMPFILATAAWPKLLNLSPMLLAAQDDLTEVTKAQLTGPARPLQKAIQNTIPRISDMLFPDPSVLKISPCAVTLCCLSTTISTMRAQGESPSGFSAPLLKILIQLLTSESQRCVSQKKAPAESSQMLCMVFAVLEAVTASSEPDKQEYRDMMVTLASLHSLFYLKSDKLDSISQQIQPLFIRVILNVTNSNPAICDTFANREMVGGLVHMVTANFGELNEDALGQENNALDSVILALGALINLTEQSEASRTIFLDSAGPDQSFLESLTRLFATFVDSISTAHSVVEVHHNVAVGYLAVLLLTLAIDNETRSKIKSLLASKGLATVISTVDEFLQYHRKVEQEASVLPTQGQPASGFMARLQELIAQIRLAES